MFGRIITQEDKYMRTKLAFFAILAFLAMNSTNALAVTIPSFTVSCGTTGSQLCDPAFSVSINTTTDWRLISLKYNVPASHCSSVRLHIFVDGALVKTTKFLGYGGSPLPLTTGMIPLQSVRTGVHVVSIKAEGQSGGCNTLGYVGSWGGSLELLP